MKTVCLKGEQGATVGGSEASIDKLRKKIRMLMHVKLTNPHNSFPIFPNLSRCIDKKTWINMDRSLVS